MGYECMKCGNQEYETGELRFGGTIERPYLSMLYMAEKEVF